MYLSDKLNLDNFNLDIYIFKKKLFNLVDFFSPSDIVKLHFLFLLLEN